MRNQSEDKKSSQVHSRVRFPAVGPKNGRIRRLAGAITMLGVLWYAGGSCSVLQALFDPNGPQFRITGFSIEDISLEGLVVRLDTELKNPYPVGLPQSALKLDVSINANELTKIQTDPISVAASSSTAIPVKFELQFAKLKTFFQNVSSVTDYTLGLRGSADFPIKLGSMPTKVSVPLSMEKKLPAFIPDVSLENVDFSAPSLMDGADAALSAAFDLRIENQAAADFLVNGLNYSMDLGGSSFLQGKSLQTSRDGNASVVRVDSSLPILGAGRAFLSLFKSGGSNYRIRGDSDVAFPGSDLEKTDFQFDKSGKLSW